MDSGLSTTITITYEEALAIHQVVRYGLQFIEDHPHRRVDVQESRKRLADTAEWVALKNLQALFDPFLVNPDGYEAAGVDGSYLSDSFGLYD